MNIFKLIVKAVKIGRTVEPIVEDAIPVVKQAVKALKKKDAPK